MLHSLKIENFALIDNLHLELGQGLNVLTGETGAGKSIILDAIDAVLGGKVSGRMVRTGATQATIVATFASSPDLDTWIQSQGFPPAGVVVCSRDMGASSNRLRLRLNGAPLTKRQGEELRDRLVEITAQGQTVHLGKPSVQREWLDSFGGAAVVAQRQTVAQAYGACQQALQALEQRRKADHDRHQQLDLWQYQLRELAVANLEDPQELEDLLQEQQRLSHGVELQQQSYEIYQALYQNDRGPACADLLGRAEALLQDMVQYDPQVQAMLEMVSTALTQVEEAGRQINAYGDNLETDPQRLEEIQGRIAELKQLCRKYGPELADAIAYYHEIQGQVDTLTGGDQSLETLTAAHETAQRHLQQQCQRLTQLRQRTATDLEARLIAALKPLAMERVQFQVELMAVVPAIHGADQITFRFSPNPGEPLQALGAIASGGEMSRFLLALKACFSQVDPVGTMIFDEIDVGVSGRVSQAIAQCLHDLSHQHQVLCVTHQPLIAAMADRHFRVRKTVVDDDRTVVAVDVLGDRAARQQELAELAGGESAQEALRFAESLLAQAADRRHPPTPDTDPAPDGNSVNPSAVNPSTAPGAIAALESTSDPTPHTTPDPTAIAEPKPRKTPRTASPKPTTRGKTRSNSKKTTRKSR